MKISASKNNVVATRNAGASYDKPYEINLAHKIAARAEKLLRQATAVCAQRS